MSDACLPDSLPVRHRSPRPLRRHPQRPPSALQVERIKAIDNDMKRHHWWLTGTDDLPACVVLSLLKTRGFARADGLQTGSQPAPAHRSTPDRHRQTRRGHRTRGRGAGPVPGANDYGILAALCLFDHGPAMIAQRISEYDPRLAALDPPLPAAISATLAADLACLDLVRRRRDGSRIGDPQGLREMLGLIHLHHGIAAMLVMDVAGAALAAVSPHRHGRPYGPV